MIAVIGIICYVIFIAIPETLNDWADNNMYNE